MALDTEQWLIFRAPGRLLPNVPDGIASQKNHFITLLSSFPNNLGDLVLAKEKTFFFNVLYISEVMSPRDPIQFPPTKNKQTNKQKTVFFCSIYDFDLNPLKCK